MYHCHSDYSLLDSCTKYQDYVDLAVKHGQRALSISEHGKPLNWCEKWAACKNAGIKYIHSVEIYLTESLDEKKRDNYHTVLMARNMDGVIELNKLVTLSCQPDHFYYTNRITFDEFLGMSDNIISTSACLASPLNKLEQTHPYYYRLANKYDFLEVQPHVHEDQVRFNKELSALAKQLGKPLIAGTDTHSSSKYKAECRAVLLASKHKSYGDEDAFDLSYKTYDELVAAFESQGALSREEYMAAIENTNLLYDMVEDIDLDTTIKYPILYGSREEDSKRFVETIYRKFEEKLASGIIPESQKAGFESAIKEELRVFQKLKMDGFMLSMSELVSWCKENGISIGNARGSVGGSRIAYVTDIIDLNPETWNTVFSRFANEDRVEIGDIDIDCIDEDRPRIFEHIIGRFGRRYTARVASFGTAQSKGVIDDVGRYLAQKWEKEQGAFLNDFEKRINPWSLSTISDIKSQFDRDAENTMKKYPELFYYYDGLLDTKVSQSVHPAGMVISPITLDDNFGTFDKDGDVCLMLDMENVHDYTGLAKYDFLVLKTVQVIRDTCDYIGVPYPKSHEINWDDKEVWADMRKSLAMIFQFESPFAADSFRKFKTDSIMDMSLVTACIRPSGASYRDDIFQRKIHKNPSEMIDELLKENLGYLIYQEDTIKFLQQICGLSGSAADNIRRAIGRKQKDRLDAAMPSILEGYCSKSDKPREEAEKEAKEFLQVIEDSASYQFGFNHSIAYCLLGYLCGYFRYYYPLQFITSYLNNAADDGDVKNGTAYANRVGIKVTMPRFGVSRSEYAYDTDKNIIAKGLSSVKYMSDKVANELYQLSKKKTYTKFMDVLKDIKNETSLDARQLEILIKIDFFADFGNQRELLLMVDMFSDMFKNGDAKQIKISRVAGSNFEPIIKKYAVWTTKAGKQAANYTLLDIDSILYEVEDMILSKDMPDLEDKLKVQNFADAMGYAGYVSGKEEDRKKLYIMDIFPLLRKKDGVQFGYSFITKSIGSGKEARFTVFNRMYNKEPAQKGDIVYCKSFTREGQYFTLTNYEVLM